MKKPTNKKHINLHTLAGDLKNIFNSEELLPPEEASSNLTAVNFEAALQLFDELRSAQESSSKISRNRNWSHPSVLTLNASDPVTEIILRARRAVWEAIEQGWGGPPYDPFTLAEMRGIKLLPTGEPTKDVLDASIQSDSHGRFTILFNPHQPTARMRYSIAHEIGHTLFPDCALAVRNRAIHRGLQDNDWQLESLCNIAAAEILMPFGTLQEQLSIRPSMDVILELRRKYRVSCEAIINRLIRLTNYPCLAFLARRDSSKSRYFVEYRVTSSTLEEPDELQSGTLLPPSSKVSACTAVGSQQREDVAWIGTTKPWSVEYLGLSSNVGDMNPRVLGLAFPTLDTEFKSNEPITFAKGDATNLAGAEPKILVQVVNDQAQIWGGGFAKQVRKRWPNSQTRFREWAMDRRNLSLGSVHSVSLRPDLTLMSLVAQHGFGRSTTGPRLRYNALFTALDKVAKVAREKGANVHMPRIGAGEAGGSWTIIEDIIRETLVYNGIHVTVYDLKSNVVEFPRQPSFEFPRELVDEVM